MSAVRKNLTGAIFGRKTVTGAIDIGCNKRSALHRSRAPAAVSRAPTQVVNNVSRKNLTDGINIGCNKRSALHRSRAPAAVLS